MLEILLSAPAGAPQVYLDAYVQLVRNMTVILFEADERSPIRVQVLVHLYILARFLNTERVAAYGVPAQLAWGVHHTTLHSAGAEPALAMFTEVGGFLDHAARLTGFQRPWFALNAATHGLILDLFEDGMYEVI